MKLANMLGDRFRETPADCQIISQIFMIRGGYMKQVANGIYSLNMPARRIVRKIENILREEMDAIDGQEVLFPVVMPADLWRESGRYDKIGSELARFKDRSGNDMVLGMTHEEASVQLVRGTPKPESAFPFMIYQIQTKFRDEPRARGGLIRVREFTMKDAYSFHTSQADLEKYYDRCYHAYERIFARCGGLADAIAEGLAEHGSDFSLKAVSCDGIEACRAALMKLSHNVPVGNFVEGMACVGGCIGGAGCLTHGEKNKVEVDKYGHEAHEKTIGSAISTIV